MCGICGEIRFGGAPAQAASVARMAEKLAPRGPDGVGLVAHGRVAFGHRRLKIIDLSEAVEEAEVRVRVEMCEFHRRRVMVPEGIFAYKSRLGK